ncbi:MAG: GNAT family N-acetyltransferase [Clostridia bacterium]|nr:GNAT family N-acetyltransferase [Clostridia bacterium]
MKTLFPESPSLRVNGVTLHADTAAAGPALQAFKKSDAVYRYLPTFLFERRYPDVETVIARLYTEAMEESLILGVYRNGEFCGLAEFYGYKAHINKISVGYRLAESCWGKGTATEALRLMVDLLYAKTPIEIITASTMVENKASARVLQKNGFTLVVEGAEEDWGYPTPTKADKWIN